MATSSDDISVSVVDSESDGDQEVSGPSEATPVVVSLLDRLKSPATSRKRKVLRNPPSGKKKSSGSSALNAPKVPPIQRVKEFPNEDLTISATGKLFCNACRETLCVKRSTITGHIKSAKHAKGKAKLKTRQARELDIAAALKKYDKEVYPQGENLPNEQRVYRVRVLTSFLRAGVPITKLPFFRDVLEENSLRLTERSHMIDLIPFILAEEKEQIKEKIKGNIRWNFKARGGSSNCC